MAREKKNTKKIFICTFVVPKTRGSGQYLSCKQKAKKKNGVIIDDDGAILHTPKPEQIARLLRSALTLLRAVVRKKGKKGFSPA